MMREEKVISKDSEIIIYGCGEVGSKCFHALSKKNFQILYGLDKIYYGDEIIQGISVYKLGTEPDDKENKIVVVCLADGMLHKKVADDLYKRGYKYLVCLPMEYGMCDIQKRQLTRIYNAFLYADSELEGMSVAPYSTYKESNINLNNGIIREKHEVLTVWCGIEMLFTESIDLWIGDKSKVFTKQEYMNKNISANIPGKALFDLFDLKSLDIDEYFKFSTKIKTDEEKEIEFQKREKLFRVFKLEHNRGLDFFVEGAPWVTWNPRHYWNLEGGHHRTLYLLHERHSLFPVKVRKADFDKWSNRIVYDKLRQYLYENNVQMLYAPLPHPAFINFPSKYENNGKTKLEELLKFLADKDISTMSSLDCLEDESYFARIMDRVSIGKSVFRSNSKEQLELAKLCNDLLYRDVILENNQLIGDNTQYDIVFGKEEDKVYLKSVCRRFMFVDKEISINNSITDNVSKNYVCLLQEYRNGIIHEFGVYIMD